MRLPTVFDFRILPALHRVPIAAVLAQRATLSTSRRDASKGAKGNPPHQAKRRTRVDPRILPSTHETSFIPHSYFFILNSPMPIPSEKQLLEHACHFGHPRQKWNPKIAPYLYGTRKGIHIFDLEKTKAGLVKVIDALKALQAEGKTVLFVSTKQQSIPLIENIGKSLSQPIVTKKWIPGLLTNWPTIRRRLQYYLDLRSSFQTGEVEKYTKKEQTQLRKELTKLDVALAGVSTMSGLPDALFVVDAVRDHVAVLEAKKLNIPVYGICDSNADPDEFTACIPANDDAVRSLQILLDAILDELSNVRNKKTDAAPKSESPEERTVVASSI